MGEEKEEEKTFMKMLTQTTCPECGTKYPVYLEECPNCGVEKKSKR